jgi:hypothetical protein
MMNVPTPSSRQQKEQIMATRAPHRDDDHPDDRNDKKRAESSERALPGQITTPRNLEKELAEVRAVIRAHWKQMEAAMRYLADR